MTTYVTIPADALRALADTARRVADGELDRVRVPEDLSPDLADTYRALDALAARARVRTSADQRFTADVAHELRTPLTGLVTAAELLPPGRPTELVRDRVQKMRTLVEDLLEVSRLDARVETADLKPYALANLVRRIVANTMPDVEVRDGGEVRVLTDARRVERVLSNLLANAVRHGAPPVVVIVDGPLVVVRDHGPGFPDELVQHGPRRFRTAKRERGQGHGLGLTIASGQAAVVGAELRFANHPHGGAAGILDLSARLTP